MPDNVIKKISIDNEYVGKLKTLFLKAADEFKPEGIEEDLFTGDVVVRKGENITYINL